MTALTLDRPATPAHPKSGPKFDLGPITRGIVGAAAIAMSVIAAYATMRGLAGIAPAHPNVRNLAIVLHVSAVLPAIPLGGYLLLAAKGTKLHKLLGKMWIAMMVVTALSAIFIQTGGGFSWIHVFVPITLHGAWKTVSTARAGNISAHKKHILGMYLGALMIPGAAAFLLPSRLMNVWLLG